MPRHRQWWTQTTRNHARATAPTRSSIVFDIRDSGVSEAIKFAGNNDWWGGGSRGQSNISPRVTLTNAQITAIQNIVNKYGFAVDVVGSRAAGTAHAESDFDYVIGGTAKIRAAARALLPRRVAGGEVGPKGESGIDILNASIEPTDPSRPYIRFTPANPK